MTHDSSETNHFPGPLESDQLASAGAARQLLYYLRRDIRHSVLDDNAKRWLEDLIRRYEARVAESESIDLNQDTSVGPIIVIPVDERVDEELSS